MYKNSKSRQEVACACGCGEFFINVDDHNRYRAYKLGHATRKRVYPPGHFDYMKGNKHGFSKGQVPWNRGNGDYIAGDKNPFYGKKHTEETRAKMRGEHNGNWNGGSSRINDLFRKQVEYIEWRTAVFIRDNRTCVLCGSTKQIEADHIKPFSKYPELRLVIDNGRTLCHDCHKLTPTYGNRRK